MKKSNFIYFPLCPFSFTDKSSNETFEIDDEQFELYAIRQQQKEQQQQQDIQEQLLQQHNKQQQQLHLHLQQQKQQQLQQQQLPQNRNKRLEKLKKLKLREIQSLALEGGDTGRGYCSCDEQWTGSTSGSATSSPSTSISPTTLIDQQQLQLTECKESQCQLKLQNSLEDTSNPNSNTASPTTSSSTKRTKTSEILNSLATSGVTAQTQNMNSDSHEEKTSEIGCGTNDATGENGCDNNRTNKQCNGSTALMTTTTMSLQKQHNETDKINMMMTTMVGNFNECNNFTTDTNSSNISPGGSSNLSNSNSNIKTITLRRNPIQQRLKQQHHVRFSDEKNFSD